MILVVGGAGYIGSHFVRRFLQKYPDARLVVLDNLSAGHRESLSEDRRVEFVEGNFGDTAVLAKLLQTNEIEAVVHFAAFTFVGESEEKPFKYFNNNVGNTLKLFGKMDEHGVKKIVFSSTCAVYGTPQYVPLEEKHPREPINIYGVTKLMVEQMLHSLHKTRQWSSVSLRYFNAAGAELDGSFGESHEPESHLIPLVLQVAKGSLPYIQVLGDDYDTADGSCIRDYVHVTDLVDAHILALEKIRKETVDRAFNLGSSRGVSVKEVIEVCKQVTGRQIPVRVAPRRQGDAPQLIANSALAQSELGWQPKLTLEDIVRSAWLWEQNRRY